MKKMYLLAIFGVFALIASCKKDKETTTPANTESNYFFKATVDKSAIQYDVKGDGTSSYSSVVASSTGRTGNNYVVMLATEIGRKGRNSDRISVTVTKRFDHDPAVQEKKDIVKAGGYSYVQGNTDNLPASDGVIIEFTDSNGKFWTTRTGSQERSSFSITAVNTASKTFDAVFSCKVYDSNGVVAEIENAAIRGQMPQ